MRRVGFLGLLKVMQNVDCSESIVLQPWLSEYVDSVPGVIGGVIAVLIEK